LLILPAFARVQLVADIGVVAGDPELVAVGKLVVVVPYDNPAKN
jgi:hypothetical protein